MDFFFVFKLLILESWQTQSSPSEADRSQGKVPGWLEKPVLAPTGSVRTVKLPKRQCRPGPWPQCPQSISVAFNVCLQIKHTQSLSHKLNGISFHLFIKWGFSHGQNLSSLPVGPEMKQGDSWEVNATPCYIALQFPYRSSTEPGFQTLASAPTVASWSVLRRGGGSKVRLLLAQQVFPVKGQILSAGHSTLQCLVLQWGTEDPANNV